jgi:hypothetical protein
MAWMACRGCSTKFAVGLLRCPQCGAVSELFAVPEEVVEAEQEADMPKISVHGGPSSALGAADEPAADAAPEAPGVAEPEPGVPQEDTTVEPDAEESDTESATAEPETGPVESEAPSEPAVEDAAPAAPKKRAAKKAVAPSKP